MRISQILSLILVIIAIIIEILWMMSHKTDALLAIPELCWLVHIFVFYIIMMLDMFDISFTLWSSALRLHGVITVLSMSLYRISRRANGWAKML